MLNDKMADVARAVGILLAGGIVAYPTDTLYGLAVDPRSAAAVRRLFAVKAREQGRAIPLIAAELEQARQGADFNDLALRLARAFWPGPLSLVLPGTPLLNPDVVAGDGTVAIRVPANVVARELAAGLGFCITATSANLSGEPAPAAAARLSDTLRVRIDMVVGGDAPGGLPSTIVDASGSAPRLVRAGAIEWDRVLRSIR